MPLIKLLMHHEDMRDPIHSNPVLSTVHNSLQLQQLAEQLACLSREQDAASPGFFSRHLNGNVTGSMVRVVKAMNKMPSMI